MTNDSDAMERRFEELEKLGLELAEAAAERYNMEHARKAVVNMAMKDAEAAGVTSLGGQEREAYASIAYKHWREGAKQAVLKHEKLRLQFEVVKLRFEYWRTTQATRRAEMNLR